MECSDHGMNQGKYGQKKIIKMEKCMELDNGMNQDRLLKKCIMKMENL